jgi:hypothetical protein
MATSIELRHPYRQRQLKYRLPLLHSGKREKKEKKDNEKGKERSPQWRGGTNSNNAESLTLTFLCSLRISV